VAAAIGRLPTTTKSDRWAAFVRRGGGQPGILAHAAPAALAATPSPPPVATAQHDSAHRRRAALASLGRRCSRDPSIPTPRRLGLGRERQGSPTRAAAGGAGGATRPTAAAAATATTAAAAAAAAAPPLAGRALLGRRGSLWIVLLRLMALLGDTRRGRGRGRGRRRGLLGRRLKPGLAAHHHHPARFGVPRPGHGRRWRGGARGRRRQRRLRRHRRQLLARLGLGGRRLLVVVRPRCQRLRLLPERGGQAGLEVGRLLGGRAQAGFQGGAFRRKLGGEGLGARGREERRGDTLEGMRKGKGEGRERVPRALKTLPPSLANHSPPSWPAGLARWPPPGRPSPVSGTARTRRRGPVV